MALLDSTAPSGTRPQRRLDGWGVLCIGVYIVLGLALALRVPLMLAPDEAAHFEYIEHIATLRSLPFFNGASPPEPGYEFHQPPLYYLISAPLWASLGAGVQNYSARLVPLLCGALTVWLVLASTRSLFKPQVGSADFEAEQERGERLARRAGMLAALWPLHIAVGSSANNDALAGLCCAALFWRLALLSNRAPGVRDGIWIGVLAGLGLLSKTTTLAVSVAAVLGLWQLSRRATAQATAAGQAQASGRQQVLVEPVEPGRILGASVLCALGVCGWNLVRNTRLYGDALALGVFKSAASVAPGLSEFAGAGFGLLYFRNLAAVLFSTSWGLYGGPESARKTMHLFAEMSGRQPTWPGGWLALASIFLLGASTYVAARGLVHGSRVPARLRGGSGSARDWVSAWWSVGAGLVVLAWVQFALAHFAGAQARYLHAALLPACVLASRAWDDLPRPARAPLSWALGLVMLALTLANVFEWRTLV